MVERLCLVFPSLSDLGQVEHTVLLRSKIKNFFPGLRGTEEDICEYLIETCCIAPQAVFSTASPNKAAALHCTVPFASSPTQSINISSMHCISLYNSFVFPNLQVPFHTAPTLHSNSPAPQCQPLCFPEAPHSSLSCPPVAQDGNFSKWQAAIQHRTGSTEAGEKQRKVKRGRKKNSEGREKSLRLLPQACLKSCALSLLLNSD